MLNARLIGLIGSVVLTAALNETGDYLTPTAPATSFRFRAEFWPVVGA